MTSVLDREMYTEAEAARLLRVRQSTLHYWLEGSQRGQRHYKPILRDRARGSRTVTWAEFVEAGFLREYRQTHKVPMPELRKFIELLREGFGVPYPLADRRPFVSGRNLVYDAQTTARLGVDYWMVTVAADQLMLTTPADAFNRRVDWADNIAVGYSPDANPESPVRIQPDMRFGKPSIKGVSTDVIGEQHDAGEDDEAIAEMYALEPSDVAWALAYEYSVRASSSAA
ncbi:DUF433 domain-containing protein [Solwaraspora sp. WMMD1047]|uniref:DUF433 domain-containing protein n=1 Tax=Solwaraspora sp. WMMD1047 TaxID=3016102 RepID=UPI00241607A1|nr:DUF433 domain-containing protein [Solwaraspora sp. WMMD1047]MDG4832916.1 DUF433 domain-containing protein [Solwaraspora sp. WMMD1047]